MFISEAFAQTAPDGAGGGAEALLPQLLMFGAIILVFYFLIFRPQGEARKRHAEMIAALKKNDIVVTSSGFIGKIKSVQDDEVRLELAPNVDVRIRRDAIMELRSKTEPAPANDSKSE